jgi:hypothetical protein
MAFTPKANSTDWPTAAGRRILVLTFTNRGVLRDQRDRTSTACFLDQSRHFFI